MSLAGRHDARSTETMTMKRTRYAATIALATTAWVSAMAPVSAQISRKVDRAIQEELASALMKDADLPERPLSIRKVPRRAATTASHPTARADRHGTTAA